MEWISTKKRLPDYNVSVLVFIPEEDDHCTTGMYDVSEKWVLLDEYRIPKSDVTYWREMVDLPKDRTYTPSAHRPEEDDTMSAQIRTLQKENHELRTKLRLSPEPPKEPLKNNRMKTEQDIKMIVTVPQIDKWVKIGEVYKRGMFRSLYAKYAVLERIKEDGMREYKEVYMASDDSQQPALKSQHEGYHFDTLNQ
jgi:hypothetical protein